MPDLEEMVRCQLLEAASLSSKAAELQSRTLAQIGERLADVLRAGGRLYLCGNGGSAADALHVAAEFVGRFMRERCPLPAVALTDNPSVLTAIANDYGFEQVFARQVRALVTPADALAAISTSGKSPNVIHAVQAARQIGAVTIGFSGAAGGELAAAVDLCYRVPSDCTPRIQEAHITAWHILMDVIEEILDLK